MQRCAVSGNYNPRKAFIPKGYVSLGMAAVIKFAVDCDNISGECVEQPVDKLLDLEEYDHITIENRYADLELQYRVRIVVRTPDGKNTVRAFAPPLQFMEVWPACPGSLAQSAYELRRGLAIGQPSAYLLDRQTGERTRIPDAFWCTDIGEEALWREAQEETHVEVGGNWLCGPIIVLFEDLTRFLSSNGTKPVLGRYASIDIDRSSPDFSTLEPMPPYLRFMLRAAAALDLRGRRWVKKEVIEAWIRSNWPQDLGRCTEAKVKSMATLLRHPDFEAGGNRSTAGRQTEDGK